MQRPLPEAIQKYFSDWVLHGVEYGVFGILLAKALRSTWELRSIPWLFFVTLFLGTAYALSDEWHQSFVPNRHASAHDVAADAIGISVGTCLWVSSSWNFHKKVNPIA